MLFWFQNQFSILQCFVVLVESNDTLYGHDSKFLAEIEKIGATIIDGEILAYLRTLSEGYEVRYDIMC